MKFLTQEIYESWYGTQSPFENSAPLDAAYAQYRQHLHDLAGVLPERVLELARLPGVHDGLIVEVHHLLSLETLYLVLRGGDTPSGYYDLVLTYEGAEIPPEDEWTLAKVARSTLDSSRFQHDLFFHELDQTSDGRIEHRLLFHDWIWFGIRCRDLQWQQIPRPNRELPALRDRFATGPNRPPHWRRGRLRAAPQRS